LIKYICVTIVGTQGTIHFEGEDFECVSKCERQSVKKADKFAKERADSMKKHGGGYFKKRDKGSGK